MSLARQVIRIAVTTVLVLAVFDVAGVVVSFVLDVAPLRRGSALLVYAVWFVLGVFCGLLSYHGAIGEPADGRSGLLVIVVTAVVLVALSVAFHLLWWRWQIGGDGFVPDSAPLTLVFFGAVLAGTVIAHAALRPDAKRGG